MYEYGISYFGLFYYNASCWTKAWEQIFSGSSGWVPASRELILSFSLARRPYQNLDTPCWRFDQGLRHQRIWKHQKHWERILRLRVVLTTPASGNLQFHSLLLYPLPGDSKALQSIPE